MELSLQFSGDNIQKGILYQLKIVQSQSKVEMDCWEIRTSCQGLVAIAKGCGGSRRKLLAMPSQALGLPKRQRWPLAPPVVAANSCSSCRQVL